MKFIHLECLVPSSEMKETMGFFDAHRIWAKPISDASGTQTTAKPNGAHSRRSPTDYQSWFVKNVNEEMPLSDIKAMWIKDGLNPARIYGALNTATKKKTLKRMASGNYKPTGGA